MLKPNILLFAQLGSLHNMNSDSLPPCACSKILQFMSLQHRHYSIAARLALTNAFRSLHYTFITKKKKTQQKAVEWYRYWRSDQLSIFWVKKLQRRATIINARGSARAEPHLWLSWQGCPSWGHSLRKVISDHKMCSRVLLKALKDLWA